MSSARSAAHLGLTALRILSVICLVAATAVATAGAAESRSAPAPAVSKAGPSVVGSTFVLESCANDHALPEGGCDEISESDLSGFNGSTTATEGSKHGAANLQVSIQTIPTGLVVHAVGSGGISSSVGAGTGTADTHTEFGVEVAVGDEPIGVAVSGTIDVSGAPCTSGPAAVGVSFGDGSSTGAECPGVGQTVSATYVASEGSTLTFSASGDAELFDEAETASFEFVPRVRAGLHPRRHSGQRHARRHCRS